MPGGLVGPPFPSTPSNRGLTYIERSLSLVPHWSVLMQMDSKSSQFDWSKSTVRIGQNGVALMVLMEIQLRRSDRMGKVSFCWLK